MRRRLFEIPLPFVDGYVPIFTYGFLLVVAFLAGIALARARAKKLGIDPEVITELGLRAMIAGVVGARLFYVAEHFDEYWPQLYRVFFIHRGGVVFYGGMLGALAVLAHYVIKHKLSAAVLFDVIAPSLAIGLMFGRLGCFMNGCCYGKVCDPDMPFAVQFPKTFHHGKVDGSPAYLQHRDDGLVTQADTQSAPVHPTQLYSSACALGLFAFLSWYFPRRKRPGDVTLLFCLIYPVYRSVIEVFRGDNPPWADGLTTSQNVSVVVFVVALTLWIRRCLALRAEGRGPQG